MAGVSAVSASPKSPIQHADDDGRNILETQSTVAADGRAPKERGLNLSVPSPPRAVTPAWTTAVEWAPGINYEDVNERNIYNVR